METDHDDILAIYATEYPIINPKFCTPCIVYYKIMFIGDRML